MMSDNAKILYFELNMGASGDMLMAALLDLLDDPEAFVSEMEQLGLPGVAIRLGQAKKCGITGKKVTITVHGAEEQSQDQDVASKPAPEHDYSHEHDHDRDHSHSHRHEHGHEHDHDHDHDHGHSHSHEPDHEHKHDHKHDHSHDHEAEQEHSHMGLAQIKTLLDKLPVAATVRRDALAIYQLIAEAEAIAHDRPVDQVHFHEVGSLDAVADIVGVCLLLEKLQPDKILASPVHVGSGQVRCAHGILPVPAPATAHILVDVPIYGGSIRGELCTPTGAAILKHFVQAFGPMPLLRAEKIGYGMGSKDFPVANCLRSFWGSESGTGSVSSGLPGELAADTNLPRIAALSCNLDDMTGEALAYAMEKLWQNQALDVYTIPLQMKKNRPAVMLCCLCRLPEADRLATLILQHTTTLGVRRIVYDRYEMASAVETVMTPYGEIRVKHSRGFGLEKTKPEFDDLAAAARKHQVSPDTVRQTLNSKSL